MGRDDNDNDDDDIIGKDNLDEAEVEREQNVKLKRKQTRGNILICTGKLDPYVSRDDIAVATRKMQGSMNDKKLFKGDFEYEDVKVIEYDGAKHGFTNPAQRFNDNDNFDYNELA